MASNEDNISDIVDLSSGILFDRRLSTDDIENVRSEVWEARCKWYDIGIELGLNVSDLDRIRHLFKDDADRCVTEMLTLWLRKHKATWKQLINSLEHKTVGFTNLATMVTKNITSSANSTSTVTCKTPTHTHAEKLNFEGEQHREEYLCSCGNSRTEQFFDGICLKCNSASDLSFPFLDTKNLSGKERHVLYIKLRKETGEMISKFAKLLSKMRQSFTERKLNIKEIVASVVDIAPRECSTLSILRSPDIKRVNDMADLTSFLTEKNYLSFFHYHIVTHLIETYGTEEDCSHLKHYTNDFRIFCQRSVFEVPQDILGQVPDDGVKLEVKITEQTAAQLPNKHNQIDTSSSSNSMTFTGSSKFSLADVQIVQEKVSEALGLMQPCSCSLIYLGASDGCVKLMFFFPRGFIHLVKALLVNGNVPSESNIVSSVINLKTMGIHILCGAPGKPYATSVTGDCINLQWTKPEFQGSHIVTHYQIYYQSPSRIQENEWEIEVTEGPNEMLEVQGLAQKGISFVFKVQAVNSIGLCVESEKSDEIYLSKEENINGENPIKQSGISSCDPQDSKKLLELCSNGDYESVTLLLKSKDMGAAVNATLEEVFEGKSALMLVCEHGHISLLLTVLDCEAEVNFQHEGTGETALILAAKQGHLRVVRFLLAYGGDPKLTDHLGRNASQVAKEEGHEIVSEELRKGKPKGKIRHRNVFQHFADRMEGATDFLLAPGLKLAYRATKSLIGASRSNDLGSVKYIIDHAKNLDINVRESDKLGWSALMWATERNNLEMVELLLTNKADTNIVAKSNQWTALMLATRQGNLRIVKALLDHGADPNAQNDKGFSSLSLAVYEHHTEIAMLLVHRGAEVNVVEESGNSPLTHACVENDMELVNLFCDHGANVNHQGVKGWSPLMEAARKGYKDIVEELVRRGADLNMRTEAGESAIHAATVKGHVEVVEVLATYEADLNMPNKDGLTALMVAADKGYQSIVEALLVGGVDVDYKHQVTGWPAIFFAAKNGRVEILRKLLERGAGIELKSGLKLVDVASFFKRKAIVDEINKKPPTQLTHTLPQPTPFPHEMPRIESGWGGIELTSFTKKESATNESTKLKSATRPVTEESHDHKAVGSVDTESVEAKQVKLEKLEIGVKDALKSEAKEPSSLSLVPDAGGTVQTEVSISDSEITTESRLDVGEVYGVQMAESPVDVYMLPPEVEVSITSATEEPTEQPEPAPDILQPLSGQDTPTTTQSVPEEDIAEIAKIYELFFKALDQRMNVENVKKSSRKGVADIHRLTNQEEIAS